jgi:hypothetical protein
MCTERARSGSNLGAHKMKVQQAHQYSVIAILSAFVRVCPRACLQSAAVCQAVFFSKVTKNSKFKVESSSTLKKTDFFTKVPKNNKQH